MAKPNTIEVLNRLLQLEYRSLPRYLAGTSPWMRDDEDRAAAALAQIVADQEHYATRIAELINQRGGNVRMSAFPMEFTDLNLLSLDYLLREAINWQAFGIREIEDCVAQLADDAEARRLAEEVLGSERGHLENLQEVVKELV
jgi:ferritin